MLLPFFTAALVAIGFAILLLLSSLSVANFEKTRPELFGAAGRTFYQLLVILYLPLTAMTLSFLGCEEDESGMW